MEVTFIWAMSQDIWEFSSKQHVPGKGSGWVLRQIWLKNWFRTSHFKTHKQFIFYKVCLRIQCGLLDVEAEAADEVTVFLENVTGKLKMTYFQALLFLFIFYLGINIIKFFYYFLFYFQVSLMWRLIQPKYRCLYSFEKCYR